MTALLDDPAEVERRLALLDQPHVAELEPVRAPLLAQGQTVPHFDPLDAGGDARLLLLLETPGPSAAPVRFVSQDNRTPTGANLRRFLAEAGIDRRDLLIWNVVPWIVHAPGARNRAVRRTEIAEGLTHLPPLLDRLSRLQVAVLAGKPAAAAAPVLEKRGTFVLTMPHPSPTIACTSPAIPAAIRETLAQAAALLRSGATT